jgi:protein-tyrosine phosphatase
MKHILFVCLGNICRSPIAEGIAGEITSKRDETYYIDSAGTSAWHQGEAPCQHSIAVCKKYGIDISAQSSRPVTDEDRNRFDHIVAMDRQNLKDLKSRGFTNVHLLGDFGGYNGTDVPDPYYFQGFEGFEKVYTMIETSLYDFIEKVEEGNT